MSGMDASASANVNVNANGGVGANAELGVDEDVNPSAGSTNSLQPTVGEAADKPQVFDFRKPGAASVEAPWQLTRPVFFVGFMGAGKTSVARKLARQAGIAAVDMDTFIERHCDKKVSEIFAESGEAGFRAIETDVLRELAEGDPRLVSCGGGIVLSQVNREILKSHGFVVYLRVTAAEAASRISDLSTRPLFGDLVQAQRVIEERLPLYEEVADVSIDTAGRGTGSIAREAFSLIRKAGILWQPR